MRGLAQGLCCLALILWAGSAGARAPETSLRPVPKPVMALAAAPLPADLSMLHPRPRPLRNVLTVPADKVAILLAPRDLPVLASFAPPARPGALGELIDVSAPLQPPASTRKQRTKGGICGDPDLEGEMITPIAGTMKGCGLEDGVKITSVAGVGLSTPAILNCETAVALKNWVEGPVAQSVGRKGGGLARLDIAASYVCRPRNNVSGNRTSEHGSGRAVDVSALVLADGTAISVLKDWGRGKKGKVLKQIRAGACGPFNTVLGPGSDRHHRNHLHMDTAQGRGPYCN